MQQPLPQKNHGAPVRLVPETAQALLALYVPPPRDPAWLNNLRVGAQEHFTAAGLPTPRLERWRYSNLPPAVKTLIAAHATALCAVHDSAGHTRPLADVLPAAPDWLRHVLSGRNDMMFRYGDMALWDAATLFLRDGAVVDIPAGKVVDNPVELVFTSPENGSFSAFQNIVRVGDDAAVTIIERHSGGGAFWRNAALRLSVGTNARIRYYVINDSGDDTVLTRQADIRLDSGAQAEMVFVNAGGALAHTHLHAKLEGEGADFVLTGLNLLRGGRHAALTAEVEHAAPGCRSDQFVRSIVRDQARGVYQGKVYVHPAAQKTDAYQLSKALLLSEGAEMDTKPELEIYADDVKCSHGATTGRLDDDALFYLRSRGLSLPEAQGLLTGAFAAEAVDRIGDEAVREDITTRLASWLD